MILDILQVFKKSVLIDALLSKLTGSPTYIVVLETLVDRTYVTFIGLR